MAIEVEMLWGNMVEGGGKGKAVCFGEYEKKKSSQPQSNLLQTETRKIGESCQESGEEERGRGQRNKEESPSAVKGGVAAARGRKDCHKRRGPRGAGKRHGKKHLILKNRGNGEVCGRKSGGKKNGRVKKTTKEKSSE